MFQSIIVYSLLMGIMLIFAVFVASKNGVYDTVPGTLSNRRNFWSMNILVPIVLFSIVFGMRYDVGKDHLGYLYGYLTNEYVSKGEPLFDMISDLGWALNLHYVSYFSIIVFIQIFFFLYAFKDEKYLFPFLIFLLFTNGEWNFWMNGIRQTLATCVWIFSLRYIEEKHFFKYFLWCIVAFLFHRSAAILIILYPLLRNGRDYFRSIPLQLGLLIVTFASKGFFADIVLKIEPIISSYANIIGGGAYSGYSVETLQGSFVESGGTGLFYIFRIVLNVLIIIYSLKLKSFYNSRWFNIIYALFIIGVLSHYMFPVGAISITRPFRYFYVFQTIMFAYFLYYLYRTKLKSTGYGNTHALLYYGLITIFLTVFYLNLITSDEGQHLWYQFFFDQNVQGYPNNM